MYMEPIRIELPTVFEAMTVNSWLFLEPEPTLIDCGEKSPASWKALNEALSNHGLKISDIKKIIITHAHLDHMGMANKIVAHSNAVVSMNEYLLDWAIDLKTMLDRRTAAIMDVMKANLPDIEQKKYFEFGYEILSPLWDEIPQDRIEIFSIDDTLNFGGSSWDVIYTPGHCINQTCFHNPENGHFLSADMLLKMIPIPIIDAGLVEPFPRTKSLLMQLQSYRKIAKLNISKVFPGHFEAFESADLLIAKQIQKIQHRKENCLRHYNNGVTELMDLVHAVYPGRVNNATIFMVVGFLDILAEEGRIDIAL